MNAGMFMFMIYLGIRMINISMHTYKRIQYTLMFIYIHTVYMYLCK